MRQQPHSEDIDWARLVGPHGTSAAIAEALRDVWSEDAATRADAVGQLQEGLWHQGTVYEVTAPAVPFVADAALGGAVGRDDRIWLISLLEWIAAGSSYVDVHREEGEPVAECELERELGWVREARGAVRARLPEFLARLDHEDDPSTQIALVALAAQFPEEADASRRRVERLVAGEADEQRRIVLEVALAALGADVDDDQLLDRLPDEYYDEQDVHELRARLTKEDDRRSVYRDILENVVGLAITVDNA